MTDYQPKTETLFPSTTRKLQRSTWQSRRKQWNTNSCEVEKCLDLISEKLHSPLVKPQTQQRMRRVRISLILSDSGDIVSPHRVLVTTLILLLKICSERWNFCVYSTEFTSSDDLHSVLFSRLTPCYYAVIRRRSVHSLPFIRPHLRVLDSRINDVMANSYNKLSFCQYNQLDINNETFIN